MDLVGYMIIETDMEAEVKSEFVRSIVDLLSHSNGQLSVHQNANIYKYAGALIPLSILSSLSLPLYISLPVLCSLSCFSHPFLSLPSCTILNV